MNSRETIISKISSIEKLIDIVKILRDPNTGCPWDSVQDFKSIAPYAIEEAYEVQDAIERDNIPDLIEELGDLLFQVVFHAQIADEKGLFDFDEVAKSCSNKMIRRHPHVFSNKTFKSLKDLNKFWEKAKKQERKERNLGETSSILDGIAINLPSLLRAYKLQNRAAEVSFDWPSVQGALAKIKEEIEELEEELSNYSRATNKERLLDEVSDVLFSAANLSRKLGINPEHALQKGNKKFESRFKYVEEKLLNNGKTPKTSTLLEMEKYWQEAKSKG